MSFVSYAQKAPVKYGKVSMEEMTMPVYTPDSSANAVVLSDIGNTHFEFGQDDFEIVHERHCRIKIFNKGAFDAATVVIPYYDGLNTKEKISQLKGVTYLLENGKIAEYKLDSKGIFDEQITDSYKQRKFTLPNVKEGAVIEFAYSIRSNYVLFFKEWEFQSKYPVLWSEYNARIPEYFYYKLESQGYNSFFINEKKEAGDQFTIRWSSSISPGLGGGRTSGGSETIQARATDYRWVMKDVPAFGDDEFITTREDYVSKIKFQLQGTKYPESNYREVLNTWEKVTEAIYKTDGFASSINRTGFLKDQIKQIADQNADPTTRSIAIANFLKRNVKWNGDVNMWASQTPRTVFEKKNGSSADINLLLVGMLREAGLKANPVLLSTRRHGRVNEYYPMINNFNNVIAAVEVDTIDILLDATDANRPAYLLPEYCLNGRGRLIDEKGVGRWVDLENDQVRARKSTNINFGVKDGKLTGTIVIYAKDYAAANLRTALTAATSEDEFVKNAFKTNGVTITKHSFENVKQVDTTFVGHLSFESDGEPSANILYISPILFSGNKVSKFKAKERKFPVSYPTLSDETNLVTIEVPQGYAVEELPKSALLNLSEGGAKFTYIVGQVENKIQIRSTLSFNKKMFIADEYEGLKSFYSAILNKFSEQIVLKKISQ
ncbi:DUF3857 domain-containing protein [Solitalea lacus]|uniref:DUF3857 domain-containing protein n=1 Tax=Solitalea lacus TaxID=2911172 RepID=UPI001EDA7262|nr:DUF3857 domain-containing protein [Solitalea lacus]UKJ07385.1 DUF3857 domain-containing protein [Solitalea lacus]